MPDIETSIETPCDEPFCMYCGSERRANRDDLVSVINEQAEQVTWATKDSDQLYDYLLAQVI